MATLSNTPRQALHLTLERRKSYSFIVQVLNADSTALNLAGCSLRLTVKRSEWDTDNFDTTAMVQNKEALVTDVASGQGVFYLQAAELDWDPGEYYHTITLTTDAGFSVVIAKGLFTLLANTDSEAMQDFYTGGTATTAAEIQLRGQDTVRIVASTLTQSLMTNNIIQGTGRPDQSSTLDAITLSRVTSATVGQFFLSKDGNYQGLWVWQLMPNKTWRVVGSDTISSPSWNNLGGKPTTFPPSAHTHPIDDVTGLQAALNTLATSDDVGVLGGRVSLLEATVDNTDWLAAVAAAQAAQAAAEAAADRAEAVEGVTEVSGVVTLPADGPRVVQMYTTGSTVINGEAFAVDTALVARRTTAGVWQVAVVDSASWRPFSDGSIPTVVALAAETVGFTDKAGIDDDRYTIPAIDGVQWTVAVNGGAPAIAEPGVYTPAGGAHISVAATEASGAWTIVGTRTWSHKFDTAVLRDTFTRADASWDSSAATRTPDVGPVWDLKYNWAIVNGKIKGGSGNSQLSITLPITPATDCRTSFDFALPASEAASTTVMVRGVASNSSTAFRFSVTRESARDLINVTTGGSAGVAVTFSNGNNTTPWAHIPGAVYAESRTIHIQLDMIGTSWIISTNGARLLEGTYNPASLGSVWGWGGGGAQLTTALLDNIEVLTP